MKSHAHLVIVGAGIVGCSVAYHLMKKGWTDVVVLDQGPLPEAGGSTSHAPGLVFQTNPSQAMCRLAQRTVSFYRQLDEWRLAARPNPIPAGQKELPLWHGVGSLEVAYTPERLHDLHRRQGWATSWGLSGDVVTPERAHTLNPMIDPRTIHGAYHVPSDGVAKAVRLCDAMILAGRAHGIEFVGNCEVTGLDVRRGVVRGVRTAQGDIVADVVLICAGIWGPKIGRLAGVPIPLVPVEHQLVRTAGLPALAGVTDEITQPILRHQDKALYMRQWFDGYAVGSYQHEPLLVGADEIRPVGNPHPVPLPDRAGGMPSVNPFTARHFERPWRDACELLPALTGARIDYAMNGMFSFTPDGNPLMGQSRVKNLWIGEAVWVTHAGGIGEALANWLVDGDPGMDLRDCDLHRFEAHVPAPAYVRKRGATQYDEVYDLLHPLQQMEQPRPLRVSPFYQRQMQLGAVFFEARGWERPQWYAANEALTPTARPPGEGSGVRGEWSSRHWSHIIAAEARAARERACLFDMTSLTRFEVAGKGALTFLQRLTTNQLDKPSGSATYTLMLNERGGIRSDITVARLDDDDFQVAVNGPLDLDWMQQHLPGDGSVIVRDITSGTCAIGLWGPQSREIAQSLCDDDLSNAAFPYFTCRRMFVGEVPVTALRVSYIGELGWELYTSADYGLRLWDMLWRAGQPHGLSALGRGAFESLRLEKGYRLWGNEMHSDYTPIEAGLGWTVKPDKGDFIGRAAAVAATVEGPRRKLCCLTIDDGTVVMGKEPVFVSFPIRERGAIGFVTSAAFGYTVGKSIAYGYLPAELAVDGTRVAIDYFGQAKAATVTKEPLFDPKGERLRK
jgi:glycine cleavage system aminomethyltransferase T/glycine/D-amino acid oxidase-like deaminating enzyme